MQVIMVAILRAFSDILPSYARPPGEGGGDKLIGSEYPIVLTWAPKIGSLCVIASTSH